MLPMLGRVLEVETIVDLTPLFFRCAAYCRKSNIRQTFTRPYSEFENGQAEAKVGIVKRGARRNLLESGLPDALWLRAAHTAAVQHNTRRRPARA